MLQMLVGGIGSTVSDRLDLKAIAFLWLSAVAIAQTVERDSDMVAVKCKHETRFHLQNEMTHMGNQAGSILYQSKLKMRKSKVDFQSLLLMNQYIESMHNTFNWHVSLLQSSQSATPNDQFVDLLKWISPPNRC